MMRELIDKAVRMANWLERCIDLDPRGDLPEFDKMEVYRFQQRAFERGLMALTRDELLSLYDGLIDAHYMRRVNGEDFTPRKIRERLPHLYKGNK